MPISLHVPDGNDESGRRKWEASANGDDGAPAGREIEIAGSSDWAIRANTCSASSVAEIAPLRNALRRDAISRGEPVAIIGMLLEASLAHYLKKVVIGTVNSGDR